jgi:hypothetical protein
MSKPVKRVVPSYPIDAMEMTISIMNMIQRVVKAVEDRPNHRNTTPENETARITAAIRASQMLRGTRVSLASVPDSKSLIKFLPARSSGHLIAQLSLWKHVVMNAR